MTDKDKPKSRQQKYLDELHDKGLVKTCVVVPIETVDHIHDVAAKIRIKHLEKRGLV
jgi:hypothetical protein